jgi:UDP-N-acetylglucosamine diphosphorylase / glucose-1-phosphate thymidylyltransferase / UDP-N-acetylgalactosamine diphosphorylase / glucosamine-1-phosphate N-acetyltransferase / galactosamine-1-phosphate N-acetyltransferase
MQAIILAAGEGSRMRPLTSKRPKAMLPIAGKPLLEHIMLRAIEAGINKFVLIAGYGAEYIKEHFRDGSSLGVSIDYANQKRQLGTGHALISAESLAEDRFLVLNGDVLPDTDSLKKIVRSEELAIATIRIADPTRYGVFLIDGDYLRSAVEKSLSPPSNMANAGIYRFSNEIFRALRLVPLSGRGEYELTDGLNILASKEKIRIFELKDWMEIGRPWDILEANERLLSKIQPEVNGKIEPGATIKGAVSMGKGTIIKAGSYIEGPVFIGANCEIGPNCYIRPFSCLGNKVRIGNAVEIKNSAIMDGAKIGHLSYVGDSIIGENCNFGAGTITANLRHDNANIWSFVKGQRVDSGRRKLGVIMGDNVKTGINTSIYPGTVIESSFMSLPSATLKGLV